MKRQSYKIKHDYLFDSDDDLLAIPNFNSDILEVNKLKLSDVLITNDEASLLKLIDNKKPNIIVDDIGDCINPASERYKQFMIRCVCQKITKYNVNIYL